MRHVASGTPGGSNALRALPLSGTGRIRLVRVPDRRQIEDRRAVARGGRRETDEVDRRRDAAVSLLFTGRLASIRRWLKL